MSAIFNLQTLAFIQTTENLLRDLRISETEEEDIFRSYYHEIHGLLNHTFHHKQIVAFWNEETLTIAERKILIRNLDVSFHKLYRKLLAAFQKVQDVFLQIFPGIQKVYIHSLPSVKDLVELYVNTTRTLQKSLSEDEAGVELITTTTSPL
jgi:hypothetical protein